MANIAAAVNEAKVMGMIGILVPMAAGYRAALDQTLTVHDVQNADDLPDGELKDFILLVKDAAREAAIFTMS